MSMYIDVLNRIKKNFSKDWLTASQLKAFEELQNFLSPPHHVINIFGEKGVGKTFLAWVLQKEDIGIYIPSYEDLVSNKELVILDNSDNRRSFVRMIRNELYIMNIKGIILLTRYMAEDDIPCIELKLNQDDIALAKANLYRVDINLPDKDVSNLWELIKNAEVR